MSKNPSLTPCNNNILYLSKVSTFNECPKKYYWVYHKWLTGKEINPYFAYGTLVHKAIELTLKGDMQAGLLHIDNAQVSIESRDMAKTHLALFVQTFFQEVATLISTEKSEYLDLESFTSAYFKKWYIKTDITYSNQEGLWNGDAKTTSGMGASVAKFYHSSIQTLSYLYIGRRLNPGLMGTKIFVLTKTKVPRIHVEPIYYTREMENRIHEFIGDSIRSIEAADEASYYPKRQTSCMQFTGKECEFVPLCFNYSKKEEYETDLIKNWYRIEDPDTHLELEP